MMKKIFSSRLINYHPFNSGIIISVFGLFLYATPLLLPPPDFGELKHIDGYILKSTYFDQSRSSSYFELRVSSNGGEVKLLATVVCSKIENLRSLGQGQKIDVFAIKDNLGRNFWRVWEIYRDGEPIVVYEDFVSAEADKDNRILLVSRIMIALGLFIAIISAIYYKMRKSL